MRVLERTGATVRARGAMYKAVKQSVLLYDSKIWVVNEDMLKVLTVFHHWASQRITGMTAKCGTGGEWEYPAVDEVMDIAGIHLVGVYIRRRNITIVRHILA